MLTATSFGLTPATATTIVGAGPPSKLVFTTSPPATTSQGTTFGVTVAEEDALGNVELADSSSSISLGASGGGFACTASPPTVTSGVAAFSGCSFSTAAPTPYAVTATSGSLTPASATTDGAAGCWSDAPLDASSAAVVARATFGVETVTEQDASGNTESRHSTTALSLGAGGGTGFRAPRHPRTSRAGPRPTREVFHTPAPTSSVTPTASSGALTPATAATAVSPGKATRLVYTTARRRPRTPARCSAPRSPSRTPMARRSPRTDDHRHDERGWRLRLRHGPATLTGARPRSSGCASDDGQRENVAVPPVSVAGTVPQPKPPPALIVTVVVESADSTLP